MKPVTEEGTEPVESKPDSVSTPAASTVESTSPTIPGDDDIAVGTVKDYKDSSDAISEGVRVAVTSEYRKFVQYFLMDC